MRYWINQRHSLKYIIMSTCTQFFLTIPLAALQQIAHWMQSVSLSAVNITDVRYNREGWRWGSQHAHLLYRRWKKIMPLQQREVTPLPRHRAVRHDVIPFSLEPAAISAERHKTLYVHIVRNLKRSSGGVTVDGTSFHGYTIKSSQKKRSANVLSPDDDAARNRK